MVLVTETEVQVLQEQILGIRFSQVSLRIHNRLVQILLLRLPPQQRPRLHLPPAQAQAQPRVAPR
jgi:hypothetical protein